MIQDMFYVYCPQNNTLIDIDFKGHRDAVTSLEEAFPFYSEEAAEGYIALVSEKEGNHFSENYRVINYLDYSSDHYDPSQWTVIDVQKLQKLADSLGVTDVRAFRGRIGHMISLMHLGKLEELSVELLELQTNGKESKYPPEDVSHTFMEDCTS